MIPAQVAVHRSADPSFECPKCHWTGVASLKSFVVVGPSRAVQPKLGDGDPMNRRIKLPITVFRSTHPPGGASGPVRNRGQTGMLRKRGLTAEAGHERGLAHDLRRGHRAAPRHSIQPRRYLTRPVGDALLQCGDVFGEARDVGKLLQRQLGDDTGLTGQPFP